jgi:uncharacterized protein YxeA
MKKTIIISVSVVFVIIATVCIINASDQTKYVTYQGSEYHVEQNQKWSKITCVKDGGPIFAVIDQDNDSKVDKIVKYPMYGKGKGRQVEKPTPEDQDLYNEVIATSLIQQ